MQDRRVLGMKESTFNFNKELIFGEIGSFVGSPLLAYFVSNFTDTAKYISFGAVVGGIIGASIVFLATRIWDRSYGQKTYSIKQLAGDLAYFTPVAFLLALIVYYPVLFFLSKYLILNDHQIGISVIFAQFIAFGLIVIALNFYRVLLKRVSGREL